MLEFLGTGGPGQGSGQGSRRPVYVAINAGAMAHGVCPGGAATASSSKGLSADEILDLALISGTDPNVSSRLTHVHKTSFFSYFRDVFHFLNLTQLLSCLVLPCPPQSFPLLH